MGNQAEKPIAVAIAGLGLLGASLGMALRGKPFRRIGWARRETVRRWAEICDVCDVCCETPEEAFAAADVTILTLPIPEIIRFLGRYAETWRPGSVVSDVGSVKSGILSAAAPLAARGVHFVGGHPMAGTEKSGPESAFPELYENADVFLCPAPGVPAEAVELVASVWRTAGGGRLSQIDAARHDDLVAHTSHVLHIIASALSLSILDASDEETTLERFRGCATGFRDTSRIASSSPLMWRQIIENNRPAVLRALRDFECCCDRLRDLIADGDFDAFEREFARGKLLRDSWIEYKNRQEENDGRTGN